MVSPKKLHVQTIWNFRLQKISQAVISNSCHRSVQNKGHSICISFCRVFGQGWLMVKSKSRFCHISKTVLSHLKRLSYNRPLQPAPTLSQHYNYSRQRVSRTTVNVFMVYFSNVSIRKSITHYSEYTNTHWNPTIKYYTNS